VTSLHPMYTNRLQQTGSFFKTKNTEENTDAKR